MPDSNRCFIVGILCLQTLYNCIVSIIGQYIYGYFLEIYPDSPHNRSHISLVEQSEQCSTNATETTNNSAQAWAQQRSADLIFRLTLCRAFPVIVVTYVFGLYASQLNRRIVLFVSILGNAIHVVIYQGIIYRYLAEYWWYVSAFIAGCAGGTNVLSEYRSGRDRSMNPLSLCLSGIVTNLVITETTDEHDRSPRFVRLGAVTTALSAMATFGIGYYIQWRGFTDLMWMAIALELVSMAVVIIFLKPSSSPPFVDETTSLLSSDPVRAVQTNPSNASGCYGCFDMCALFSFKDRSRTKSISLISTIIAYVFYLLALSALSPLLWYLLGSPFCWSSKDLGNFSAISLISTAVLSVLGMKVLNCCGADDTLICAFGHLCLFGYALWIALAKYSWQLYLALVINPFSGYQGTLTMSMVSKWLDVRERSNVYTLLTEINTIILAFGSSLSNWIYARTVTYQKNSTLLIAAGLASVPFVINM